MKYINLLTIITSITSSIPNQGKLDFSEVRENLPLAKYEKTKINALFELENNLQ